MVKGWIVDKEGDMRAANVVGTESPRVFIQYNYSAGLNFLAGVGIPIYSPSTPHKHYLLNDTFFTDEILALMKAIDNTHSYKLSLDERVDAHRLRIKELQKREIIMNNEKREAEEKALVEAANKKLLTDIAPKPYQLNHVVSFTSKEHGGNWGNICEVYLGNILDPEYDIRVEECKLVRVKHSEIYSVETDECK